jgi:hypothetical protein
MKKNFGEIDSLFTNYSSATNKIYAKFLKLFKITVKIKNIIFFVPEAPPKKKYKF